MYKFTVISKLPFNTMLKKYYYFAFFILFQFLLTSCDSEKSETKKANTNKSATNMFENDPHSYAKPQEAVITHLDWEATVDFDTKTIDALASLSVETWEVATKIILDTKGLNIKKITLDGGTEEVTYSLGDEDKHMGSALIINILPETKTVNISYSTAPDAEAIQWLNPAQTAGKRSPFLLTQSEAILARSWIPIQDSPGIRFTYNAKVKVPKGLMALMSAKNPTKKNINGIYEFEMTQPIPAYLLALAVGDISFMPLSDRTGVYAEPDLVSKAAYEFSDLENMVAAAESLYGPYQWERYDIIVLPPSFPFGGMENPRLTFATPTILAGDRSLTSLIAHELAHSWSGNLVTNDTWDDFWLNEGFTVYFEHRIMEKLYGRDYSEMLASLALQDLEKEVDAMIKNGQKEDTKLKLKLKGRNPDDGMTSIAYDKGYFFLRNIEEKVGREKFDGFLKAYFEENAFKSMTTEKFVKYLNRNLVRNGKNGITMAEIKGWIYQPGLPKDRPKPHSDKFAKVDSVLNVWKNGESIRTLISQKDIANKTWSTHEWLHFIRSLPKDMTIKQMQELDRRLNFTNSKNSEILAAWLEQSIRHDYKWAYNSLKSFLINTGRRKFLTPLYAEMLKTEDGKIMANRIYKKARPNYHFVATSTLDKLLGWEEDKE